MPEEELSEVSVVGMGEGKIVHHPPLIAPKDWISPNEDAIADMVSKAGESMAKSELKGNQGISHETEGVEIPE